MGFHIARVRSVAFPLLSVVVVALTAGCGGDEGSGSSQADLENRPWVLVSGIAVPLTPATASPSATFAEGRVGGSTGCNRFTGPYTLDGDSLEIGQIASTRMACIPPADRVERSYLGALGKAASWRLDGEQLVLADADGAELLRYAPATE